jgi:hypothetical protein
MDNKKSIYRENDKYYVDVNIVQTVLKEFCKQELADDGKSKFVLCTKKTLREVDVVKNVSCNAKEKLIADITETVDRLVRSTLLSASKANNKNERILALNKKFHLDILLLVGDEMEDEFKADYLRRLYKRELTISRQVVRESLPRMTFVIATFSAFLSFYGTKDAPDLLAVLFLFAMLAIIFIYSLVGIKIRKQKLLSMQNYQAIQEAQKNATNSENTSDE